MLYDGFFFIILESPSSAVYNALTSYHCDPSPYLLIDSNCMREGILVASKNTLIYCW